MVLDRNPPVPICLPFTEEHEMFRKSVRAFIEKEIAPHVDDWEAAELWPAHDVLKKMGNLGFLGLSYPAEYGGAEADIWFTVVLMEELGRIPCGGVPMGISVHSDMCTPALAKYGSDELRKQFLEPAIKGTMVGAIAVTEPEAGSDVAGIITRAMPDGDDYYHWQQDVHHQRRTGGLGLPAGTHFARPRRRARLQGHVADHGSPNTPDPSSAKAEGWQSQQRYRRPHL
jgi:alkylation response protein AidB-like acyl-CoA dehydrogenase